MITFELKSTSLCTFNSRSLVDIFDAISPQPLCDCRTSKHAVDSNWFSLADSGAGYDLLSSKDRPATGGNIGTDSSALLLNV